LETPKTASGLSGGHCNNLRPYLQLFSWRIRVTMVYSLLLVLQESVVSLSEAGFVVVEKCLDKAIVTELSEMLDKEIASQPARAAGLRNVLQACPDIRQILKSEVVRRLLASHFSKSAFGVRAILFDKTPEANWYVTWHQDTSIAVRSRHKVQGYESWSEKDGVPHVRPPANILNRMVTLRFHLDPCGETNGPLRVIPKSHRHGILSAEQIAKLAKEPEAVSCIVDRGGCLVMSPLLIHSSSKAKSPSRRRVLHIEFADVDLPEPLDWFEKD
jgi:hypothetical protein